MAQSSAVLHSFNGLTDALQCKEAIEVGHVRHEEVAAFAAAGEAQTTCNLAVCARSCGPGNLHLINGLFAIARERELCTGWLASRHQQVFGSFEVRCVRALSKFFEDRQQQRACVGGASLAGPESCEIGRGPQLPSSRAL
jgi:hypothetical protein